MEELLKISPDVMFRELEGEAVLLDLKSQQYFGLDAVGTRIWQVLVVSGRPRTVVDTLLQEFDVPREHLEQDVATFLSRLTKAGLVSSTETLEPQGSGDDPKFP